MKSRWLKVLSLLVGAILIVVLANPNRESLIVGGILVVAGQLIRIWATGHLIRNDELTTSGPYAYVRDPLYLGRLLLIIGLCIMAWGYALLVLPLALIEFFYDYMPRKYRQEMTRLERLFGDAYREYAAYAHSLLPRLKPYPKANSRGWQFDLTWNVNREQYFALPVALICLLIIFRHHLPLQMF